MKRSSRAGGRARAQTPVFDFCTSRCRQASSGGCEHSQSWLACPSGDTAGPGEAGRLPGPGSLPSRPEPTSLELAQLGAASRGRCQVGTTCIHPRQAATELCKLQALATNPYRGRRCPRQQRPLLGLPGTTAWPGRLAPTAMQGLSPRSRAPPLPGWGPSLLWAMHMRGGLPRSRNVAKYDAVIGILF